MILWLSGFEGLGCTIDVIFQLFFGYAVVLAGRGFWCSGDSLAGEGGVAPPLGAAPAGGRPGGGSVSVPADIGAAGWPAAVPGIFYLSSPL